jgi:hypothetical protein
MQLLFTCSGHYRTVCKRYRNQKKLEMGNQMSMTGWLLLRSNDRHGLESKFSFGSSLFSALASFSLLFRASSTLASFGLRLQKQDNIFSWEYIPFSFLGPSTVAVKTKKPLIFFFQIFFIEYCGDIPNPNTEITELLP